MARPVAHSVIVFVLFPLLLASAKMEWAEVTDATTASSLPGITPEGVGQIVVSTIEDSMEVGSRRLVVLQDLPPVVKSNAPLICGGLPAIVSKTPSLGGNGACFLNSSQPELKSNLSCTCLTYLKIDDDEWLIRLKSNTDLTEKTLIPVLDQEEPIEVDSSLFYGVAQSVKSLRLIGVEEEPVKLQLRASPVPGAPTTVTLIISSAAAQIKSMYIENIDFGDANVVKSFVPNKLTNLTMRNCNINSIASDMIQDMERLQYLDLSSNNLVGIYQDITPQTCSAAACPIKHLNLSDNQIKAFPSYLLNLDNLESLSLEGNAELNTTVDTAVFNELRQLKTLEVDPFTGECMNGTLAAFSSATLCVLNATTLTTLEPTQLPPPADASAGYLMYVVIGGCLIIAVLVFILVKKNLCRHTDNEDGKEPLEVYFGDTLTYEDTHATISASLLNDPIIITNRLPYKDLRVANCISKGGFGLVYSGVYNRRRVAIKKIRPDRAGDIKQIESFLKEICLIATLNHPRIVEFIGVSWDTLRNLCAVTEFMERGDLREVLQGFKLRNKALSWESHKTTIALHIAEGLTYLHSLSPKIVHRDLKSKNVLVNGEMVAKLSDFGISRERHIEETHMTAGIGTSFWIAPEVLLGKDYDERADIFSFGVVLSEIDTDDYPYWNASNPNVGNKAQESMILQMVASGAMRPSFSDACPQAILELADLCLEVDPQKRPTAAEVAYKLQLIVQFMNPPSTGQIHLT